MANHTSISSLFERILRQFDLLIKKKNGQWYICFHTRCSLQIYMYVHLYIYVYMYTYIYVHICIYINIHIHIYIHICIYIHTYIYSYTQKYTHASIISLFQHIVPVRLASRKTKQKIQRNTHFYCIYTRTPHK